MNELLKMTKIAQFICKNCQKKTFITLKNKGERKEFKISKNDLNCHSCSFKYWEERIKNGQTILEQQTPEFRRFYWEEKKKFEN